MINYLTTKNRLLVAILAFILPFSFARAEVKEDGKTGQQGWYVGIEGGMPFGFSTFSSFGHDKTHLGWAAGLYVNPAKRNVLDLKNETCKNREKRNVLKISHTRHFKTTKKQSKTGCFYSF